MGHGSATQTDCLRRISAKARTATYACRFAGWLMMFVGSYLLFSPFLMLLRVLPFIGPFLSHLGSWLIWFLCFLTTFLLASLVITSAYLVYHPMIALGYILKFG